MSDLRQRIERLAKGWEDGAARAGAYAEDNIDWETAHARARGQEAELKACAAALRAALAESSPPEGERPPAPRETLGICRYVVGSLHGGDVATPHPQRQHCIDWRPAPGEDPGLDLDEIERVTNAATPGPWSWFGNTGNHEIDLATTHSGRIFVMSFRRWGIRSAQPCFQDRKNHIIQPASELVQYEVPYRKDITGIDHPDAEFIAKAREWVPALVAALRRRAEGGGK